MEREETTFNQIQPMYTETESQSVGGIGPINEGERPFINLGNWWREREEAFAVKQL